MRQPRRPLKPSRRLLVVLALQAIALGLLATGALGTALNGPQIASTPLVSATTDVDHDTSVPLDSTPVVPNDPNRTLPELERTPSANVSVESHDAALQTTVGGVAVPSTIAGFAGLKRTDMSTGYVPPDTVGDVGPTQYVQAVNGGLAVFSKTGDNLTGAINDSSFWNGLNGCQTSSTRGLTDPTVNYDEYADRWVYATLSYDTSTTPWRQSYMCVAVSATGDATGSWNRYAFLAGNGVLPDYPKLGVWPDGYYLSFNLFDNAAPHNFVGAGAMALERSAMLTGSSAQGVFLDLRNVAALDGGMLPSDADGATAPPGGSPNYYVSPVEDPTDVNDQLGVWAFAVDWAAPANSTFTNPQALQVLANNADTGRSVAQPGTSTRLDGLADVRLMNRLQYRNFGTYETLVTNLSVDNGSGGLAPRWYELRKSSGSWAVNQQSTFAPDALDRWVGSVAMDGAGDMALGYSAGDGSTAAGLRYTGRLVGDSLSTMEAETTLVAGGGVQTGSDRWGDYSQLTVDPTDDCTFWFTGEYYSATGTTTWETRIGSFRFPSCVTSTGPTYSVVPVVSGTLREGQTLSTTDGTWAPAPTATTYQWRACDPNGVSCADIPGATASTYLLQPDDAGRRLRVKVTVTAATGTSSIVSAATTTILPLAPSNSALPTVAGTAQVAQTLSATTGTWSSYANTSTGFTYQWQRCAPGCAAIPGATSSTYTLAAADAGATVRIAITASSIGGSTTAFSNPTATVALPPAPVNTVAPSLGGTAAAGQTLTLSQGTWTGASPIAVSQQWQSCDSSGASCSAIGGQTGTTYLVNAGDVGRTLRAAVTAANSGGSTVVTTSATAVVAAASSGGSSSGGGSGAPDLQVTGFASNLAPLPNDNVTLFLTVLDKNAKPAQNLLVTVTLPAGVQFVSGTSDRGSGCKATSGSQVVCSLDWLSGDALQGHIQLTAKVLAEGTHTLTATATAQQGDLAAADNTLSLTLTTPSSTAAGAPGGLNGNGSTPATTSAADHKKPTARALRSTGARSRVAKLRFRIYDDQGVAKALATIKRNGRTVATVRTGFGPVAFGTTYYVGWRVPAKAVKGRYTFCVVAVDRARNASRSSCAPLALK